MNTTSLPASKLVNISVTLQASSISELSFAVPMIWDIQNIAGAGTSGNVNGYQTAAEMLADGYHTWDAAYRMAASMMAQNPRPTRFKVGCIDQTGQTVAECLDKLTALSDDAWYFFLIADPARDAQTIKDASAWAETQENTKFLMCAQNAGSTAPSDLAAYLYNLQRVQTLPWVTGGDVQVQEMTISAAFASDASITLKINGATVGPVAYNTNTNTTLGDLATAIAATDAVATAVAHTSTRSITITAASPLVDVVITNYAGGGATPTTATVATTTDSANPVDAAAVGRIVPLGAGEATMGEKTLTGISPLPLTSSQASSAEAVHLNYYARIGGRPMTYPGVCSADIATNVPLWADLVFGAAAFKADLLSALLDYVTGSKKIPYNDSGIAGAVSIVAKVAKDYVGRGYLEPFDQKVAIRYPLAADVPANDKSLRILNGITGTFQATGAIQQIGLLTVTINA